MLILLPIIRTIPSAVLALIAFLVSESATPNEQEIFKNFQAATIKNRFNPLLPPSLDSTYKHP